MTAPRRDGSTTERANLRQSGKTAPAWGGNPQKNGAGLTSGPGLVNGLGYTRDPAWQDWFPTVEGLENGQGEPQGPGLGAVRDLVNGLSVPVEEAPEDGPRGLGPRARRRRAMVARLRERSRRPPPGNR
jgi:hypothetical protein